ncbi:MAG: peptidylprolyl isomerase [Pseudorhodoplanes sp.]|nr:peptidylprolyl isomerase [Pseudorhodoplanes sp.]
MNCSVRDAILPKKRVEVAVNGVAIPRDRIAREIQNHPSGSPIKAWGAAAQSLVVRELLLQEARRLGVKAVPLDDGEGRRETEDEAAIRALIDRQVVTPAPDTETCRRYYEQNRRRFRSADIYEAAHILLPATTSDPQAYARARETAVAMIAQLQDKPELFSDLVRTHSACPSRAQGGHLGQISSGQTTPEFEQALAALAPGALTSAPVATRYGFHIIRLDRGIEGRELPFEIVADRIADYLTDNVRRRATAQYIARLVSRSVITGLDMPGAQEHRVN